MLSDEISAWEATSNEIRGDDENVQLFLSNSLVSNDLHVQLRNVHYENVQ